MRLKHDEGWNIPACDPFYPSLPAVYRHVKMQLVFFEASPEGLTGFLPEPLEAAESGLCVAGGVEIPYSSSYGAFEESFLMLACRFRGHPGFYCSHVFHNGPAGIAAGREIYGTPKVYAEIKVHRDRAGMRAETAYQGSSVLTVSSQTPIAAQPADLPALTPNWRLKIIPRADGPGPALKQLIDCANVMDDVAYHHVSRGDGSVTLGRSASCDLTPLAPRGCREAFYFELSYAEGYGEIAYDYLKGNEETAVNTARPPTTSEKHG